MYNPKIKIPIIAALVLGGMFMLSQGTRDMIGQFMDIGFGPLTLQVAVAAGLFYAAFALYKDII